MVASVEDTVTLFKKKKKQKKKNSQVSAQNFLLSVYGLNVVEYNS